MLGIRLQYANHQQNNSVPTTMDRHVCRTALMGLIAILGLATLGLAGCGTGGYPGGGLTGISVAAVTIDAGQSYPISIKETGTLPVDWSASCAASTCGTFAPAEGASTSYVAPTGVTAPLTVTVTALIPNTQSKETVTVTVDPDPALTASLGAGLVGTPYSGSITAIPGTAPLTVSVTTSQLPPGLSYNASTGLVSGTPTMAGTFTFTAQVTDSSAVPYTVTQQEKIVVTAPIPTLAIGGTLGAGTVGVPYAGTLVASGGVTPYTFSLLSGSLPPGLVLAANGSIAGIPSSAGTYAFVGQVKDATGATATGSFTITVATAVTLTLTAPPSGTVGVPYSGMIGVSGGTAPYTCIMVAGALPTGLTENGCAITGTPTQSGSFPITVKGTDSAGNTTTGTVTLVIAPAKAALTISGNPPAGMVGIVYSSTLTASGGTSPYTFILANGTLPAGLTLSTTGVISGIPTTPGTSTFVAQVTDSTGAIATASFTITIAAASTPPGMMLTLAAPPSGTVGVPYTGAIGVSGGTAPYTCTPVAGTLPTGLTENGCNITGTPTQSGSFPITVTATDSANPANTTTGTATLVIAPANMPLTLAGNPPNGTVGVAYTTTLTASGGTSPYTFTTTSGNLPPGLTLSTAGVISGTPTAAGTYTFTGQVQDATGATATTSFTITIGNAVVLQLTAPAPGTVGVPYMGTIGVSGGTGPYTCVVGTPPPGLTANNCTLTGTPTLAGSYPVTVTATDSSSPTNTTTGTVVVVISPATVPPATLTITAPPAGTIYTPYTGSVGVSGGTAPYTCALTGGALPAGLTLGTGCAITGTPTQSGSFPITVKATDAAGTTTTSTVPLTIAPLSPLTLTGSVPNAVVGVSYTQTLTAQGGLAPYTYATTAGSLPPGLTLSTGGVISGVPTTVGAYSFTVTATDAEPTPMHASLPLIILVSYAPTPQDAALTGPYAFLFQGYDDVTAGVLAYQTATVASFTADGKGVASAGEQDANHQSTTTTGATTSNAAFLGTYTLGANYTGSLTITTLNPDGTVHLTTTYALSVKAPAAPATTTTQGSLIEADGNQTVGTKGSGTLLPQTATAFSPGLIGSYAFGTSGDAPCFLTCTANLAAGPVATVGQLITNGSGAITGGTSDSNDATTVTANSTVSGTYGTADANGRLKMSLVQSGSSTSTTYPTNFAVYVVNANEVFLLSTDSHATYILQAGTAQLQTQPTFSNASMGAAFVGYENSYTNPGLVGTTLQNTLNLSTATLFRGVGGGAGTCTITSVDTAGTTALLSGLTGILGSATGLSTILGETQQTGSTACTVATNGRGVLQYPDPTVLGLPIFTAPAPRVFYLISPNNGYFLETAYAGLGRFEAQTGTPYSYANTFNGTYVVNDIPASSLASTDDTGTLTTNGAGQYTGTQSLNIGVGTINVLQLGLTNSGTYTQPDAITGRFTATGGLLDGIATGNLVIYAITPNRFVAIDTSVAATSPSVSLLY